MIREKSSDLIENILLLLLSINLVSGIINYSMLKLPVLKIQLTSVILLFVLAILANRFTVEQITVGAICIAVTFISWMFYGATSVMSGGYFNNIGTDTTHAALYQQL